jgi:sugar lactone lactonase YvrE
MEANLCHLPLKCALIVLLAVVVAPLQAQTVSTVAGGYIGDRGPATSAGLIAPWDAAFDFRGNLYIADHSDSRIRRVDTSGNISTIAGNGICAYSGDGGPAVKAQICFPTELAIDRAGHIFFADTGNQRIREIDSAGTIVTVAGNGTTGFCGDGGLATAACLNTPIGIAITGTATAESLFIADEANNRIRKLNFNTGIISTVAGNGIAGYAGDGKAATKAELNFPSGVAVYPNSQSLWISDRSNNVIRRVNTQSGIITTSFGSGRCSNDLQSVCLPNGIAVDTNGNLYVTDDGNSRVLELPNGSGKVILEAGAGVCGFNGDGIPATSAMLCNPWSITFDNSGSLVIADTSNNRIRRGSGSQSISTIAGGWVGDGGVSTRSDLNADFFAGITWDSTGNLYMADQGNNRVRQISVNGTIDTFAGTGFSGSTGNGGLATAAEITPLGVASFGGNLFIADGGSVRRVDSLGIIIGWAEQLPGASGITADAQGNLYVASFAYCVIWKISPQAFTTIVAGTAFQCGYNGDGILATDAELSFPTGVTVDSVGNLYIADEGNNRIRRVDPGGLISTIAGTGVCGFSGDGGPANSAMLCVPTSVSMDVNRNNLYVADSRNYRVRKITHAGKISTFAGTGLGGYNGDRLPALQTNMWPTAVAVSPSGAVYVFDDASQLLRRIH